MRLHTKAGAAKAFFSSFGFGNSIVNFDCKHTQ